MVVKNVDYEQLAHICHKVAVQICQSGFCPDVVIGIKSGGMYPAAQIYNDLKILFDNQSITLGYASLFHRAWFPTGIMKGIFKILPYQLLDRLRILSLKFKRRANLNENDVTISGVEPGCKKVLVVDDAVDSGATLDAVIKALKRGYPIIEVKSAVLTVTMDNPIVNPDFSVYHNQTILRLPWAVDAK